MNKVLICEDVANPYLNNPEAYETAHLRFEMYEGRFYKKLSYEIKMGTAVRLIKIIQVIALTIISCFVALAFEQVRKMWADAVRGQKESVTVLIPQDFFENTDIGKRIISFLSVKDLLAMGQTSTAYRTLSYDLLTKQLNAGDITPRDFGVLPLAQSINKSIFCSSTKGLLKQISLNFEWVYNRMPKDIREKTESFLKLNNLILEVNSLDFFNKEFKDFSFFKYFHNLTNLRCTDINNINFLKYCPKLTHLNLSGSKRLNNIKALKDCQNLIRLNLRDCNGIWPGYFDLLQNCSNLRALDLGGCLQIQNFDFLGNLTNMMELSIAGCIQVSQINSLRHLPHLQALNIAGCDQITDLSPVQHCQTIRR